VQLLLLGGFPFVRWTDPHLTSTRACRETREAPQDAPFRELVLVPQDDEL